MKKTLIGIALALVTTVAAATCITSTYTQNGKLVVCTTCCYGNQCTTTCI